MTTDARCTLCQGRLVQETKVQLAVVNSPIRVALAWVCTQCSAAFPIAIGSGGIIRDAKPLYERGVRHS